MIKTPCGHTASGWKFLTGRLFSGGVHIAEIRISTSENMDINCEWLTVECCKNEIKVFDKLGLKVSDFVSPTHSFVIIFTIYQGADVSYQPQYFTPARYLNPLQQILKPSGKTVFLSIQLQIYNRKVVLTKSMQEMGIKSPAVLGVTPLILVATKK